MIIHGADDPLFPIVHAEDQAAHIPNAELVIIPGMGHDLPDALAPHIAELIARNAARAVRP
jgi:pimeloyl-ACP methyl ester carboxylesterase